jgi:hypothetical protein
VYSLAYDAIFKTIENKHADQLMNAFKNNKINVNLPLSQHNNNTLYTLAVIKSLDKKRPIPFIVEKILQIRGEPIKNVLGLTYLDYMNDSTLYW